MLGHPHEPPGTCSRAGRRPVKRRLPTRTLFPSTTTHKAAFSRCIFFRLLPRNVSAMGRNRWTTSAQTSWLVGRIPAYLDSKDRDVRTFHAATYKLFIEKWPLREPSDREIAEAGGDTEKAKEAREMALKKVRPSTYKQPYKNLMTITYIRNKNRSGKCELPLWRLTN